MSKTKEQDMEFTPDAKYLLPPGAEPLPVDQEIVRRNVESAVAGSIPRARQVSPDRRLVVVEQVYCQQPNQQPEVHETRWNRTVAGEEPVYRRPFVVGNGWQKMPRDDFPGPGLLVIENLERSLVIEVGVLAEDEKWLTPFTFILPGEDFRITPVKLDSLRVRSQLGQAQCHLRIYPS